jgi:hypothetical protein
MSEALEGIWFSIANNHHLHNPIDDQPGNIQATINRHGKSGANQKPPIRLTIANDHQLHNPINETPAILPFADYELKPPLGSKSEKRS